MDKFFCLDADTPTAAWLAC